MQFVLIKHYLQNGEDQLSNSQGDAAAAVTDIEPTVSPTRQLASRSPNAPTIKRSWEEANNCLEEVTDTAQQKQLNSPAHNSPQPDNPTPLPLFQQRSKLNSPHDMDSLNQNASATEVFHDSLLQEKLEQDNHGETLDDLEQEEDSLQNIPAQRNKLPDVLPPDSLSFDETTFTHNRRVAGGAHSMEYYDSIGSASKKAPQSAVPKDNMPKKLIIPYADSYSSNTSIFTSHEESLASKEDEEETTPINERSNPPSFPRNITDLTLDPMVNVEDNNVMKYMLPPQPLQPRRPVSANPIQNDDPQLIRPANRLLPTTPTMYTKPTYQHASNPDLRRYSPMMPPPEHQRYSPRTTADTLRNTALTPPGARPTSQLYGSGSKQLSRPLSRQQQHQGEGTGLDNFSNMMPSEQHKNNLQSNPSLVKLATERMKKKFLGWN